ncbi:hypothetical protein M0R72_10105 [Candidatus Pacearchaeota archaeon]|jgi:hypothetical protein|nr:hypothetical protein [Candidatus Pacearchaeota archaeon]
MAAYERLLKHLDPAIEAWEEEIASPYRQEAIALRTQLTEANQTIASLRLQLENMEFCLT